MDLLISLATGYWNALAPTTWFMLLGLLLSYHLLRKILF